jgi:peptidoglycan biosynthesis protein MviN/MurJ (putative lipid II flippase)
MNSKRGAVSRAAWRIALSSAGEVAGRAINLLLPFILFVLHSVNAITDYFFIALAIAFFFQGTLANSLVNTLVLEFVKDEERRSLRNFMFWTLAFSILAALIAAIPATELFSPEETLLIAVSIFLISGAGLASAPATAILYSAHRYTLPGLTWGLRIIPIMLYFHWQPSTPQLHLLLIGLALADTTRFIILCTLTQRQFTLQKASPLHLPSSALQMIMGAAITGMTPLLARWIASFGEAGNVTIFETADRIYSAIASLATIGVGNVMLVYLSRLTNTQEEEQGWRLMLRASFAWSLLWLALSFILWLAFPLLTSWFQHQAETAITEVRRTFLAFSLGMPGFIMTILLSRRILTLGLFRSFITTSLAGLTFSTAAGAVLFTLMGTSGIALALSGTQYLVAWMLYLDIKKASR